MAVSTSPAGTDYNMGTAAGAHAFFLALDAHMTKVGLTPVTTGSDYNIAGTDAQMPTTAYAVSPWLVYEFNDAVQSTHPITIWFRIVFGHSATSHAASLKYVLQYRISEGNSGTTPLGDNFEAFFGVSTPVIATAATTTFAGSQGDFVRYDGNSLTVILGANEWLSSYNTFRCSLLELHIERRYSSATGLVQAGFTGWVPTSELGSVPPAMYVSGGYTHAANLSPVSRTAPYMSSGSTTHLMYIDAYIRPTTTPLLVAAGAAVAAPVYLMDEGNHPVPAMKLFTVPLAQFVQGFIATLDFTGVEKKYLIYRPYSTTMSNSVFAFAIEWE